MIASIIFLVLISAATLLFVVNIRKVRRNIFLGKAIDRSDHSSERWKTMAMVALGQSKMVSRPVAAVMHIFIYVGFVLINVEVLEMFVDGVFNTHRVFSFLGGFYDFLIAFFEILAFLVTLSCVVFFARRNIVKIQRFLSPELKGFPRSDANLILITEIVLMTALFLMNAADQNLQLRGSVHYHAAGTFPISGLFAPLLSGWFDSTLMFTERFCWWFHIVGILAFLNYLPYSKHLHIVLAFPNVYYSNLKTKGQFSNLESVTHEVKAMFDTSYVPPAPKEGEVMRFGAKDVQDLSWKQLLDAYSCTECGRCTSSCPANITGKLLSPRKIMMDTRDRLVEVGKNLDVNKGQFVDDGKVLLGNYITEEELWACTSCNACVQECPINIDPLSIIMDMRRFLVMEQSASPQALNAMFTNIENNGAPWQFSPMDRANWINEK
jgi:heterodisulfide reductase subunit C